MSMSYEEILQGLLDRVPSNVDKREGSIIYDALAPCAYFLAQQDFQIENFVDLVLPDTAIDTYLDKSVAAFGITRKPATAAVRQMIASAAVSIGTRWAINSIVYSVAADLGGNVYEAICETTGEIGNQYSGALTPLSNITGVTAELTEIITAGTDEETDEALRERFFTKVQLPATSGNVYHYQQWAMEVPGVGNAKVFPLDDGPGTVTVLVVDDDGEISEILPVTVAEYIETVRPIGATVTVAAPEPLTIDVSANILLDGSKTLAEIEESYRSALNEFLHEMIFETYRVSYAKVSSLLLDTPGVDDYDSYQLNGVTANITVGEKQIPVLGSVTLTEVSALAVD